MKYDFTKDTVTPGGDRFNFAAMTDDEVAERLSQGDTAEIIKAMSAAISPDAEVQAHFNKWAASLLGAALKVVTGQGTGALAGIVAELAA